MKFSYWRKAIFFSLLFIILNNFTNLIFNSFNLNPNKHYFRTANEAYSLVIAFTITAIIILYFTREKKILTFIIYYLISGAIYDLFYYKNLKTIIDHPDWIILWFYYVPLSPLFFTKSLLGFLHFVIPNSYTSYFLPFL